LDLPIRTRRLRHSLPECPFCLASGLFDGDILDRDERCNLVTTGDPMLQASVMIIPHRHVATPFEVTMASWNAPPPGDASPMPINPSSVSIRTKASHHAD
jgi:hypothetical protein